MAIKVPGALAGTELAALRIPAELVLGPSGAMAKGIALDAAPSPATVTLAVPAVAMRTAGTRAVNWPALTKVVTSGVPFHCTVELAVEAAPDTVRVKAAPPGAAELGLRLARVAAGDEEMESANSPEETGPSLKTGILAVPGAAIKAANTTAVNCVALTRVVGSAAPFQATVALERKLPPFTVRVKSGPPTNTEAGMRLVMAGVGACTAKTGACGETSGPGLTTWIACDPTLAIALAGTLTVS